MEAILTRDLNQDKQTLGSLVLKDSEGNKLFACKTLELPWLENKNNKSCIPVGSYNVVTRKSARYGTHFHVTDVPNRTFILIHAGNTYNDTRGCILLGSKLVDINGDEYKDVANSLATIKNLIKLAPNGFCLEVKNKVKRNAKA